MENNTTTGATVGCVLGPLLNHPEYSSASVGTSVLIGAEFIATIFTILSNAIVLWTIARTTSLQTPSNTLLAALCCSDLFIGLITHPTFIATLMCLQLMREPSSMLMQVLKWSGITLSGMSFFTVLYITLDRYVAVCFPFLYERQATIKKYIAIVVSMWVFNILITILNQTAYTMYYGTVTVIAFGVMFYCYIKIYLVIIKKERAIIPLGTIGDVHRAAIRHNREERRKSYTIMILLAVFTISYLPPLAVTFAVYREHGNAHFCILPPNTAVMFLWSLFFLTLSSMFNPIVYCIFMTPIRNAALKIFCRRKNMVLPM